MKAHNSRPVLNLMASLVLIAGIVTACAAQQTNSVVPTLMNFSGTLIDANSKPLTNTVGVTFYLYKDEQGGSPLWMETQNVTPDKNGHYTVALGSTTSQGLPTSLFASGEARWLGVQTQGQAEQSRMLLLSVPYALKAGDAQTVGGLSPSAFVLATALNPNSSASSSSGFNSNLNEPSLGGTGKANYLPIWTNGTTLGDSVLFQSGKGSKAQIGIGTTKPAATLDLNGSGTVRGLFSLPATGTATTTRGFNSQPIDLAASVFNSGTSTAVTQTFQWQAEPVGNNTSKATGSLNLLFGQGTSKPSETGLNIASTGQITFAKGQTFPGTGSGTVTSVGFGAPSSDFSVSGSPVTTSGTLSLAWNVAPTSANTANAIVKRDTSGNFGAGTISAYGLNATNATLSNSLNVTSSANAAIQATDASTVGIAVYGVESATSGLGVGVWGVSASSNSSSYAVYGQSTSSSGSPVGVYGLATSSQGIGEFGQNGTESSAAAYVINDVGLNGVGVWGDGGASSFGNGGVVGTVDDGVAGLFVNNSPDGADTVYIQEVSGASNPLYVQGTSGVCYVDTAGDINCSGAKNAVVPIDGGNRTVALAAIESPNNWFEDAGSTNLVNGAALVAIDPDFMQTVNTEAEYQVFLTPYGDCKGLYVTNRTANGFEVRELGGGTSSLNFGYRIMALRKNYEHVRFADHTHDLDGHKRMLQHARAAGHNSATSHMPAKTPPVMHTAMQKTTAR